MGPDKLRLLELMPAAGLTVSEAAALLGKSVSQTSRDAADLVADGYLTRAEGAGRGRPVLLTLTRQGRALLRPAS